MVIAVSASRDGCRGGNLRFSAAGRRAAGQCRDRDRVRVSGAQANPSRRRGRNRAGITAFYFTGWRGRFITANAGLSTSFSPGDTLRRDKPEEKAINSAGYGPFWTGTPRAKLSGAAGSHDLARSARNANGRVAKAGIWQ
jgi:hypothetical protein